MMTSSFVLPSGGAGVLSQSQLRESCVAHKVCCKVNKSYNILDYCCFKNTDGLFKQN